LAADSAVSAAAVALFRATPTPRDAHPTQRRTNGINGIDETHQPERSRKKAPHKARL